ncbi:MAG: transcriptional regulator [Verrucomicrobiaceae bacterium]|nr:MAG: transcriptional regulator [Verrucomicrobiaceae bacterium]
MSSITRDRCAGVFAALGDSTRLGLVDALAGGLPRSITELSARSSMTRQAVTKHLGVLEHAGVVRSRRSGRSTFYQLEPDSLRLMRQYLDEVSNQWEDALGRLKAFVEDDGSSPAG